MSGFLLFLPIAARGGTGSKRAFVIRRAGRIVPAYLVSFAATIVFVLATTHPPLPVGGLEVVALHLVFLQHPFGVSGFGVHEIYWTLSILAMFYLLLPLVAERYLRHPLIGLAIAMAVVATWRIGLDGQVRYLHLIQFPLFAADFAIGMTASWLYLRLARGGVGEQLRRRAVGFGLAALAGTLVLLYEVGTMRVQGEIFYYSGVPTAIALAIPVGFAAMMAAHALMPRWAQWPLANRLARFTGTVSYGVLLFHVLVLLVVVKLLGIERDGSFDTFAALTAIVVPTSVAIGWLSFKLVEEPARVWSLAVARRIQPAAARGPEAARPAAESLSPTGASAPVR